MTDFNGTIVFNSVHTENESQINVCKVAPTGISENSQDLFYVFPNPAKDIVNVHTSREGNYFVSMTDLTGRVIYKKQYSGKEFIIDISDFTGGMYFVTIENGTRGKTMKIVVD